MPAALQRAHARTISLIWRSCAVAWRQERLELTLTATREVGARWRGERGRIDGTRLAALVDHPETLCFVCGPAAMMHDVPLMLMGLGVAKPRIFVEEW